MSSPKTIIITAVPKYIGGDNSLSNQFGVKLKTGNSVLRCNNSLVSGKMAIPKSNSVFQEQCEDTQAVVTNRKRRLDHLTLEEKLQRKKLKNRMAAQSSRDRKKARLDDLEAEVKVLRDKNEALILQCQELQLAKANLASENKELHQKLLELEKNHRTNDVCCRTRIEPAEFSNFPLPQGRVLQQALGHGSQVLMIWKMLAFSLLSQISSTVLMEMCVYLTWMSWQKAYSEKLPKNWKQGEHKVISRLDAKKAVEIIMKWWGPQQKMWKPVEN